jgi:hypothetical protein
MMTLKIVVEKHMNLQKRYSKQRVVELQRLI